MMKQSLPFRDAFFSTYDAIRPCVDVDDEAILSHLSASMICLLEGIVHENACRMTGAMKEEVCTTYGVGDSYFMSNPERAKESSGERVRFVRADDSQVRWGSNHDPRKYLVKGNVYEVVGWEIHSWHTKLTLRGFPNLKFNSVHFEVVR